ncbi:MAG: FAD-dependent oxidoreductase [Bacteroidales bacterium]|nr:FAD-dependent oxidoreductase [Bacteroidales bacterium]
MSRTALIIGTGLGGLLCGQILSRKGLSVTLLEADEVPGGILHGFTWEGVNCDRGFHSVGGLAPGQPLEKIFRPLGLGLTDLPWYRATDDEGLGFLRLNQRSEFELEHILAPFRGSTWRLEGGGNTLVRALAKGLDIHCGKKVVSIENQTLTCEDGSTYSADVIISDLHPVRTMELVKDHVRPSYTHRLQKLQNGPDIFAVHCLLERNCVPWQSGAIFLEDRLMIHFDEPGTQVLELLCFGEGDPEEMIALATKRLPGLKVQKYHTMLCPGYGIIKESNTDFVSAATPLPWLFLTGQNLGLHGILGTSISALNTCKLISL